MIRPVLFGVCRSTSLCGRKLVLVAAGLALGCQAQRVTPPVIVQTHLATTHPIHPAALAIAKDLFYKAVAGDLDSLAPSLQMLYDMGGGDSSDPQVVAYTGAATLLKAAHAPLFDKSGLAHDGLALEDKAVAQAPSDLEVRFLRGVTCYRLPRFMGRSELASSDLAYVAQRADKAVKEGRLDRRAAAASLVYYG